MLMSTELLQCSHERNHSNAFRKCQSKRSIESKALKKILNMDECNAVQEKYDLQKNEKYGMR